MFFSTFFSKLLFYNNSGDFMRKYYLFIIKKDFYDVYKNNTNILYIILENIYHLREDDFVYGISIYNQLCQVFNREIISSYFNGKNNKYIKKIKNKFFIDDIYASQRTCLQINYSCVVLKTNSNIPYALRVFNWYNNNIFVCDFDNKDYFFLNKYSIKKINYAYC